MLEFRDRLIHGLAPTLRIAMGPVDLQNSTLAGIEAYLRDTYELHKEVFPHRGREREFQQSLLTCPSRRSHHR